jgi:hypothetical protein
VISANDCTPWKPVTRGVPQGSCLSPLLFNVVVRNLPRSTSSTSFQFADDVSLSESSKHLDALKLNLSASFSDVKNFCESKGLSINTDKTQFIIIKAPTKLLSGPTDILLDGISIAASPTVKLLGVTIDRHLTFKDHVVSTSTKCHGLLGLLRRAAPYMSIEMLKLTYTSLIRSHLEYCSSLLIPLAKTHQIRLETIQKIASRIICRAPRNAHSAPLLAELNLHSLLIRRNSHACQIVRNSLEGHCHPACAEWFSVTDEGVVQTVGAPLTAHGRKTFKYAAANLFNEQLRLTLNR